MDSRSAAHTEVDLTKEPDTDGETFIPPASSCYTAVCASSWKKVRAGQETVFEILKHKAERLRNARKLK
jgi:hypothetical protein